MPILQRTDKSFEQECAACGAHRTVANGDVAVRTRDGYSVLELPPCPCGAVEVLLPSLDDAEHPRPGGEGHLHQLAVDELATRVCNAKLGPKRSAELTLWLPAEAKPLARAKRE